MHIRLAYAKLDGTEYELIEPIGEGINSIYRNALPADGSYATVFHHFCVRVKGGLDDWERHLAGLHPGRRIHFYREDDSPTSRFVYTDDRAFLGHFVEHTWFHPDVWQRMQAGIPSFSTE